ncbi:dephospho-CoA kinase [Sulfurospirillum diekertiae]|uniref:Dephospho-CoA kinase n=1 Tax=Sulfurospirillum diekertiae TaxID=1854492 RepID=A0A290H9Z7_9BACT|nr:dephospho-CoA kinase [Sulfurospirillum diekertiae]ATB68235.1 dephospho-CoA kinase [Sulfurospirillum diekertiae]QIR76099.1 dephospho-CoA kinase [Sulfurospirillum diekertiae]QIR78736.1 dephospho-CoA kinase [Sulfurospirillum diekertiae]
MAYEHAIVLTGGIATGKSTVSSMLKSHGFEVIDADVIAKEVLPLHVKEVETLFGDRVIRDGSIDRKALGALIFNDKKEREKLNAFLHPLIRQEIFKQCDQLEEKKTPYIIDIPLYFESDGYACKLVTVVYAPVEVQRKRLMIREDFSKEEAQKRIDAQISIEEKKILADFLINNSFDMKFLESEIEKFIKFVRGTYANCKI